MDLLRLHHGSCPTSFSRLINFCSHHTFKSFVTGNSSSVAAASINFYNCKATAQLCVMRLHKFELLTKIMCMSSCKLKVVAKVWAMYSNMLKATNPFGFISFNKQEVLTWVNAICSCRQEVATRTSWIAYCLEIQSNMQFLLLSNKNFTRFIS